MRDLAATPGRAPPTATAAGKNHKGFAADRATLQEIAADEAGQRIDNYLFRSAKGVPKSHVYRVIRGGEVRVNKKRVDADYRLATGDRLRLPPMRTADAAGAMRRRDGTPQAARADPPADARAYAHSYAHSYEFPLVFEDEDLLVIDKPAGVAVHGGSGISFGVIEQLRAARPALRFMELVHRLDRDTSGLLMIAKKRGALVRLHEDIREGRVEKHYLVCVAGTWTVTRRRIAAPLVKFLLPDGERRVRVEASGSPDAMPACTIFNLVERLVSDAGEFALLDADLKTGRTHQIRVHLAHLGFPIVGDEKYGDFALNKTLSRATSGRSIAFKRMFLHAAELSFMHPRLGTRIELKAPLPAECERFLVQLRQGGAHHGT